MSLLVIFDIDGTLLFSNRIDSKLFAATYESRYGKTFPSIDWTYFPHVTDHTIFRHSYYELFDAWPENREEEEFKKEFTERIQEARMQTPEEFQPVPGVGEFFSLLKGLPGHHVAVATGGWGQPARVKLNHVGLLEESLVISAADTRETREQIVQGAFEACGDLGYTWERAVYVGDAVWDVQTCRNLNLPFIGIRRSGDHETLLKSGADQVFSDYSAIEPFLEALKVARVPVKKE
ncbi:MAG: HAD family hydrolase [Saprospiraceae bacterium]|nr:HAD family hydrolase [Saprospiraceae bacterium]